LPAKADSEGKLVRRRYSLLFFFGFHPVITQLVRRSVYQAGDKLPWAKYSAGLLHEKVPIEENIDMHHVL